MFKKDRFADIIRAKLRTMPKKGRDAVCDHFVKLVQQNRHIIMAIKKERLEEIKRKERFKEIKKALYGGRLGLKSTKRD